ncbi:unnamed protein product [Absidia cylindrospora]
MSAENTKTETPAVESTTTNNAQTKDAPTEPAVNTNEQDPATKSDDKKVESIKPTPSPSRSGTKRLSLFLSKAKKSFVPEKEEKKPTSPVSPAAVSAATAAETKALPEDPKPISEEETHEQETPAAVAEQTTTSEPESAEPVASASDDKQEKRKSKFLNGLFKKVTTPTKEEKEKEIKSDDKPEAAEAEVVAPKEEETPATEAPPTEHQTQEPTPEEAAETSAPAVPPKDTAVPKNKETNVVDQIKRHSFVNKWFAKKEKNTTPAKEEPSTNTSDAAPVIPEPAATEPITTEDAPVSTNEPATTAAVSAEEPATANDTTEASTKEVEQVSAATEEAGPKQPSSQEKPARSGSPLGRRLTQILRGFPKKEKKEKKEKAPAVKEETPKQEEQIKTDDVAPTKADAEEPKPESPAAVAAPTVQATA